MSQFDRKLLFVIDSLSCGGAEKSLVSLLPLLDSNKYEIRLWILHRGGAFEPLVPSNVIIEPNPTYSWNEKLLMRVGGLYNSLSYRCNRLFRRKNHGAEVLWKSSGFAYKVPEGTFDVAIAYQQGFPTYLVANKISAKKKIAWVNADIFEVGYNIPFNLPFYKTFDHIVPVSEKLKVKIEKRLPELANKLVCIYDILNPELICRLAKEQAEIYNTIPNETVTIVTVGRMVYLKGYDLAVDAGEILHKNGIDFKWIFVGDGPERSAIEESIKRKGLSDLFILVGMQTNPYPYIKSADIYVQASRFEGFGMTIGEAKILNKPIVSTDFEVVYDQLTDRENGLIVEKNGDSIAEGIMLLLKDEELMRRILSNLSLEQNSTMRTEVAKVEKMFDEY